MPKLLVPTDFSDGSAAAARYALALARDLRCELELLHAYRAERPAGSFINVEEHMESGVRQDYEVFYEGLRADMPEGVVVRRRTERRGAAEAVQHVLRLEGDEVVAVVMGTHGETAAARVLAGSTTQKVIDEIAHPLFAVPQAYVGPTIGPRRILWAVDADTEPEARFTQLIERFALREGAKLTFYNAGGPHPLPDSRFHKLAGRAKYTVTTDTEAGDASAGILGAAEAQRSDLVVVTHGKGGFFSRIFGSSTTGETLRHTRVPVLVLPRATEAS